MSHILIEFPETDLGIEIVENIESTNILQPLFYCFQWV